MHPITEIPHSNLCMACDGQIKGSIHVIIHGAFHTYTFTVAVGDCNMSMTFSCCELVEKGKNYKKPREV